MDLFVHLYAYAKSQHPQRKKDDGNDNLPYCCPWEKCVALTWVGQQTFGHVKHSNGLKGHSEIGDGGRRATI